MSDVSAGEMSTEPAAASPVEGLSNRAVADVIGVDEKTVRNKLSAEQSAPEDENTNEDSSGEDETAEQSAPAAPPEPAPVAEAPAERALPFDVEHLGPLRRAVLDHLVDTEGPQSVGEILAAMPAGTSRGSAESAIKREYDAGRIERVGAGLYVLAKPKPLKPAEPTRPSPVAPEDEQVWLAAFEAWVVSPDSWDREVLGPRPNEPGRRIPSAIVARGVDRSRKREARRQDRELAQARQVAADAELRTALLTACNKNYAPSLQVDDLAPVREVLKVLPLDRLLVVIRQKVDKRCFPGNPPLSSWRDPVFLEAVAEAFCRLFAVPGLVREWGNAGKAPAPTAHDISPPAAPMADIDRSRHDQEHAPPGPHSLAADAAPDMPREPASASAAPAAVLAAPEPENASAMPPTQPTAMPDDGPAISEVSAVVDAKPPAEPTRASVLAAFNRNRAAPSPQPQAPPPRPPTPWFAGERQAAPAEREMSDEGWEELIAGFVAGNVVWNTRRLGPEPGNHGCRAPQSVLRRYRL